MRATLKITLKPQRRILPRTFDMGFPITEQKQRLRKRQTQMCDNSRPHHLQNPNEQEQEITAGCGAEPLGAGGDRDGILFPVRPKKRGKKRKAENGQLPPYVFVEKTRHGQISYYFRLGKGRRIRLPDPQSEWFDETYERAVSGEMLGDEPPVRKLDATRRMRDASRRTLKNAIRQARNRARRKGVGFNLTEEWVIMQAHKQRYRCALSGVPFYMEFSGKTKHNPYAPSLDRIVPALGYTIGNVRIVCFAMNMMMADWGEDVVHRVADGYRYKRVQAKRKIYRKPVRSTP